MRKITKIEPKKAELPERKKVAAYCRVSMVTERLNHSLSAQVSYYSGLIQKNPAWEYAGVFSDNGISGTSTDKRSGFNAMMEECEAGHIDIILVKSISRFARNTVDLLNSVRHLKELGVEVRFEKEHINSLSGDGEVMLSLLASFAQEESISISNNVKWGTRKRFEQGIPNGRFQIYGYRWDGDHLVIQPDEAKIVRLIYDNFLNGLSAESTEKQLEEMGVKSYKGMHFSNSSIRQILGNITYTGNLLFQKEYTVDPISGKSRINRGELPQYWVPDTHEAIIPLETYNKVQDEIARRRKLGALANPHIPTSCFTSKVKCSGCGMSYRRHSYKRQNDTFAVWTCRGKEAKGVAFCPSKNLPEPALFEASCEVLGLSEFDEDVFSEQVDFITVCPENVLVFHLTDGSEVPYTYKFKSTAKVDCWTKERRDEWGKMHLGQNNNKVKNPFTGFLRCPVCGGSFRRQSKTYADGTDATYWHCGHDSACGNKCKVPETFLKQMICEVLDIPEFDENLFKEQVVRIEPSGNPERQAVFHFADGRTVTKEWMKPKKRGVRHTQEWKDHMSEVMKEVKSHGKE